MLPTGGSASSGCLTVKFLVDATMASKALSIFTLGVCTMGVYPEVAT
jgi:hypothetical protein